MTLIEMVLGTLANLGEPTTTQQLAHKMRLPAEKITGPLSKLAAYGKISVEARPRPKRPPIYYWSVQTP